MYNRRIMEGVVLTVILLVPALSMVKLWAQKHIVIHGSGPLAEAASVVEQIL